MDVYFRDDELNLLAIVDDYVQLMWEEKLRGEGTLTIELPNTAKYRELVEQARLVTIKESKRCMIIDNVQYQITGEYTHIIVHGYPVEQFFKNRWCQAKSMSFWWKVAAAVDMIRSVGFQQAITYLFRDDWDGGLAQSYRDGGYRLDRDSWSLLQSQFGVGYGISRSWFYNNDESFNIYRRETTSYLNDYAMFMLKVFLTGLFDKRLAIPKLSINPRIILPDGRDYNRDYATNAGLTNRTAFDAYGYMDKPKDWTFGKALVEKDKNAQSTTSQTGLSAWDIITNGTQEDHFEVRFDESTESLTLHHIATASLNMYKEGYLAAIELSPLLENIDSADYTRYNFKEPTSVYGVMSVDDTYDGHLTFEGNSGDDPNSGYNRIEFGTKVDPPERIPSLYYGHAVMFGKKWTAPDGTEYLDRDLVLRHAPGEGRQDAYCVRAVSSGVHGQTKVEEAQFFSGVGTPIIANYPFDIVRSAKANYVGENQSGTVTAVQNLGYRYNYDYRLGECVRVTFADGEHPVVELMKVSGYNWNVTNGSVVHHPIFEAL